MDFDDEGPFRCAAKEGLWKFSVLRRASYSTPAGTRKGAA